MEFIGSIVRDYKTPFFMKLCPPSPLNFFVHNLFHCGKGGKEAHVLPFRVSSWNNKIQHYLTFGLFL